MRTLTAAFGLTLLPLCLSATSFDFTDFANVTSLNLVGDAALLPDRLRLTGAEIEQVGAAWYQELAEVGLGFDTMFQFQLTSQGGWPLDWSTEPDTGADGLAFVIQNVTAQELGIFASGIGYMYIPNSLAVELDTWSNFPDLYCEPDGNHVSVHTLGVLANRAEHCAVDVGGGVFMNPDLGTAVVPSDMSDGEVHVARIVYIPGRLNVFVDDLLNPVLSVLVDLSTVLGLTDGKAYVGFTSSTGGAYENHDIVDWKFTAIPEPGTLALALAATAVLGVLLLRRKLGM
jgi:hypothetical protein